MINFGKGVVKLRIPILIVSIILLFPAALGYFHTRVNYDILTYLPKEIDTMKGQDILLDEFGTGAFSMCVVEGMEDQDISKMRKNMEKVDHVKKILWYDSLADLSIPKTMLPDKVQDAFINEDKDATLMVIFFDSSMSSDETMDAIEELRSVADKQCYISGMSAVVTDTKNLSDKEVPIYVLIAVILAVIVLSLTMDSALIPVFFLLSIGMAIIYNLGSNVFFGEISYVTQALAAVLQLGVTMDYSIFLWHSYEENQERFPDDKKRAMAHAISNTLTSVIGSSITTVAGFVALCFMSFTLGLDLGVTMAKGVIFGVICCVTVLPSMILVFDKAIDKTRHKEIIPDLGVISGWVVKHYKAFIITFIIVLIPALWGYTHYEVYYDLAGTLPGNLDSVIANDKLDETFAMNSTHIILCDSSLEPKEVNEMMSKIDDVDGVKATLGLDSLVGPTVPREMIPSDIKEVVMDENYQMLMISSEYKVASDEVNDQCDKIEKIMKKYDKNAMLIGEAPCTKDLITITNHDFNVVSTVSIGAIFLIIACVFKSISLPIILVAVIEFAIFINMGIPAFTGTKLPFIAGIVIGTIQLGATVDYAILMTTKYRKARYNGVEKQEAITSALGASMQSVIVSALSFFAATFGVTCYTQVDMIGSICELLSRGAIISVIVVLTVLPAMFLIFDPVICRTTAGYRVKKDKSKTVAEPTA